MKWAEWVRFFAFVVIPLGTIVAAAELSVAFLLRGVARRVDIQARSEFMAAVLLMSVIAAVAAGAAYLGVQWILFIEPFVRDRAG